MTSNKKKPAQNLPPLRKRLTDNAGPFLLSAKLARALPSMRFFTPFSCAIIKGAIQSVTRRGTRKV